MFVPFDFSLIMTLQLVVPCLDNIFMVLLISALATIGAMKPIFFYCGDVVCRFNRIFKIKSSVLCCCSCSHSYQPMSEKDKNEMVQIIEQNGTFKIPHFRNMVLS